MESGMGMKTGLRIGVVGCGYWGPNLIRNFRGLADCTLAVVADKDAQRLRYIQSLYPDMEIHQEFKHLMNGCELQALVIATPVRFHFGLAREALELGKHVFIEKPMASSPAECETLIRIAEANRLTLMVGHTFLYSPAVRRLKELVAARVIGDIRYISSRRLNLGRFQQDVNVTWDLAPHDISIILHLMDERPSAVNCQGMANMVPGIEDISTLSLTFPSGRFACIQSSWLDPRKVREMTVVGTDKMIVYDDTEPREKLRVYDQHVGQPTAVGTPGAGQYSYHHGDMMSPHLGEEEPLRTECQHFVDCIRSGTPPLSDGHQGLQLVRILAAASESLRQEGARVALAS